MNEKRSHLDEKWYVVGSPWYDGECVNAGHNDPHDGIFVCDCGQSFQQLEEIYGDDWDIASPQDIAQRVVKDHNECLKLQRRIEVLEDRLEKQRTVKQDIEDLFGD